jgi:hypothetical protein
MRMMQREPTTTNSVDRLPLHRYSLGRLVSIGYLALLFTGCVGPQIPVTTIHQDSRSAVFIETVSDKSFRAAHPIKLDEATLANVLRGVHTKEKTDLLLLIGKALRTTDLSAARAFFEDDVEILTPHLTAALAQAAPNQRIGFRLSHTPAIPAQSKKGGQNLETTSGYLFADGLSLHLTLTQYRYMPGKIETIKKEPRQLPDPDGLRDREIQFVPEAAVRQDSDNESSWFGGSNDQTLVIDYQLLTKLLAMPPEPQRPAASPTGRPVPSASAPVAQPDRPAPAARDAELRAFREELKAMQKKLAEQNAELERLKKSATTK